MNMLSHRSQRTKKAKKIFSPSNPTEPRYYLITSDEPELYQVVSRSSLQQISTNDAVLNSCGTRVQILASGTLQYCQQQVEQTTETRSSHDERNTDSESDNSLHDEPLPTHHPSRNYLKRPSSGFRTPALKRSTNVEKRRSSSAQRHLFNKPSNNETCNPMYSMTRNDRQTTTDEQNQQTYVLSDEALETTESRTDTNDQNQTDTALKSNTHGFQTEFMGRIRSLQQQVSKLTKTVGNLSLPTSSKYDQLSAYRNVDERLDFPSEVLWNGKNLLKVIAKDPGDYARQLLRLLFTEDELQHSILPSQAAHLYQKTVLDGDRFKILNEAVRIKYRLNDDAYHLYYTNVLRIKLSRCLYDESRRKTRTEDRNRRKSSDSQQPSLCDQNNINM